MGKKREKIIQLSAAIQRIYFFIERGNGKNLRIKCYARAINFEFEISLAVRYTISTHAYGRTDASCCCCCWWCSDHMRTHFLFAFIWLTTWNVAMCTKHIFHEVRTKRKLKTKLKCTQNVRLHRLACCVDSASANIYSNEGQTDDTGTKYWPSAHMLRNL